jgi:hypothetical protein
VRPATGHRRPSAAGSAGHAPLNNDSPHCVEVNDSARLHGASEYVDVSLYSVVMSVPAPLRAQSTQTGRNSVTCWGKGHHGPAERDQWAWVVEVVTTSFEGILDSGRIFVGDLRIRTLAQLRPFNLGAGG